MKKTGGVILALAALMAIVMVLLKKIIIIDEKASAVSIIGGADGPTSIFIAGKVGETGSNVSGFAIVVGVVVVICIIVFLYKMIKK